MLSFMKYFLTEAKKIPDDRSKLRLHHIQPLSDVEKEKYESLIDKYMDVHGHSAVAAENKAAVQIHSERSK